MMPVNWSNWDGSQRCEASEIEHPASIDEIGHLVKKATRSGRKIRAYGAGHSWSGLVPADDGVLVNLDLMSRPLEVTGNRATFEAGVRLRDIGPYLESKSLAMENLGAITAQSLAGAIATGTHGTGRSFGILGTQMTGCTLVDGTGESREFRETDLDAMRALRLNLGALGIFTSITLQCVPSNMVELRQFPMSFVQMIKDLDSLKANTRCRIYWFPGQDSVFVNTMNPTDKLDSPGPVFSWFQAEILRKRLMGFLWSVGRDWPSFIGELNNFERAVGFRSASPIVGPSYEAITTPLPPKHLECEVAVAIDKAADALEAFRTLVNRNQLQVNVPAEIRFVKGDDVFLSPCNEGDVCYIGAYTANDRDSGHFFKLFLDEMKRFGGRAHWAKVGAPDRAHAKEWYQQGFDGFEKFRKVLDPGGVFLNPYLSQVF